MVQSKKKIIISWILFIVVFAGLLITATFTDLDISNILTKGTLPAGQYLTNAPFGATFETVGSSPIYIVFAFAFSILFISFLRNKKAKKAVAALCSCVSIICAFVADFVLFNDAMDYIKDHLSAPEDADMFLKIVSILAALFVTVLMALAVNNFSDEQISSLVTFAVAAIVFGAFSTVVLHLIKGPVGRIRFRAMNVGNEGYGFEKYARWYEINGQWISKEDMKALFGTADALKSFPSGHTNAAGATYVAIMLIDALKIQSKKVKAALWICPIVFTALVAVSRIMVGAHYFSDVLVGGTCAFLSMLLMREIFIRKGATLKAVFGKNK